MAKVETNEIVLYLSQLQEFYGRLLSESLSNKEYGQAVEIQAQIDAFEYLKTEIPFTRRVGRAKFAR